jgi:hypothetical protein
MSRKRQDCWECSKLRETKEMKQLNSLHRSCLDADLESAAVKDIWGTIEKIRLLRELRSLSYYSYITNFSRSDDSILDM